VCLTIFWVCVFWVSSPSAGKKLLLLLFYFIFWVLLFQWIFHAWNFYWLLCVCGFMM
jgi:hypothetical protein